MMCHRPPYTLTLTVIWLPYYFQNPKTIFFKNLTSTCKIKLSTSEYHSHFVISIAISLQQSKEPTGRMDTSASWKSPHLLPADTIISKPSVASASIFTATRQRPHTNAQTRDMPETPASAKHYLNAGRDSVISNLLQFFMYRPQICDRVVVNPHPPCPLPKHTSPSHFPPPFYLCLSHIHLQNMERSML